MQEITKHEKTFFVGDFMADFWKKVNDNCWERSTYIFFDKFIDKEHSYIDMGAWIGPTVLYGSQIAKHCFAIEPSPKAFNELKLNVELNPLFKDKITLINACINDKSGKVNLGNDFDFGNSISSLMIKDPKNSVEVDAFSFDDFASNYDLSDCNFIKIDIEGAECIVLPTMKEYLMKNKPTLHLSIHSFLFNNLEEDSNKVIDVLKIYKNIFNHKGEKMSLDDVYHMLVDIKKPDDLVASDLEFD